MKELSRHYNAKKVLLTGHTGFKGAWMAEWLLSMGAEVVGISLSPSEQRSLFNQLGLEKRLEHCIQDIRNPSRLSQIVKSTQPDVIFHLAAQSLVRHSYNHPRETFETNVMGTVNLLDSLRQLDKELEVVIISSDKCYENVELKRPYEENDKMGGFDPYSGSKGACELVTSSYRRSFFNPNDYGSKHGVALASARSGNVIGGGDWSQDRIVPDCIRALSKGLPICVRNPLATRPWQHVLEPLGGYLVLGTALAEDKGSEHWKTICSGFNFGPQAHSNRSVKELVEELLKSWEGRWVNEADADAPHEAQILSLSINKASELLDWQPVWDFSDAVSMTGNWYRSVAEGTVEPLKATRSQLLAYTQEFVR